MDKYIKQIIEAITGNQGASIVSSRPLYSSLFVIPVNILSEVGYFLNSYVLSMPLTLLKLFVKIPPTWVSIFMFALSYFYFACSGLKANNLPENYYAMAGAIHVLAYMSSSKIIVSRSTEYSSIFFWLNKVASSAINSLSTAIFIYFITLSKGEELSVAYSSLFIFLAPLIFYKLRASLGRRVSLIMIASSTLYLVTPYYFLAGIFASLLLVVVPAYIKNRREQKTTSSSSYTHRDLEIMKAFGQSSASGYAFEERVMPLIDSMGYHTKFAKWYKDNGDYPVEYSKTKGDGGIDLIAESSDSILVIQCKFYNGAITADIVAKTYISRKAFEKHYAKKGDKRRVTGMIITNSNFDQTALADAKSEGIICVDGDAIKKLSLKL